MLTYACPSFGAEKFAVFKIGNVGRGDSEFLSAFEQGAWSGFGIVEIAALQVEKTFAPYYLNFA